MDNTYKVTATSIPSATYNEVNFFSFVGSIASGIAKSFTHKETVFDELVKHPKFISEAKEARQNITSNRSQFTNLAQKYSDLIE